MEQVATAIKGQYFQMQEKPEQIGCPDMDTHCEKHGIELHDYGHCEKCEEEQREADRHETAIREAYNALNLPERLKLCTFDNYSPVNSKSKHAFDLCQQFARKFQGGGLIMLGGVGTGKTHLAVAICQAVCAIGKRSEIATVTDIIRKVRSTWNKNNIQGDAITEHDIINSYSRVPLLVIDEIGSQYGTDSEKILVSEIINNRYNNMLPTIVIGNITLSQTKEYLGERAIDRIKHGGHVVIFDWESYRK